MFQPGDKYIHFTKYGGVNTGTVKESFETTSIDYKNRVAFSIPVIKTDKGICLSLDGSDGKIYKITGELSEEKAIKIEKFFNELTKSKRQIKDIIRNRLNAM